MAKVQNWPEKFDISNPEELMNWLKLLNQAVNEDSLVRFWPPEYPYITKEPVSLLLDRSKWPDSICLFFREKVSGQEYMLDVDVYHGAGGAWSAL